MIAPAANTEMMNLHLEEISAQTALGACAVMPCDRAGRHQQDKDLRLPDNVRLLPLPPYSPELNPMENVWDYLRQNQLCSIIWDSYDEIVEACKTACNWLIADPDRIRSIDAREWATVNVLDGWHKPLGLASASAGGRAGPRATSGGSAVGDRGDRVDRRDRPVAREDHGRARIAQRLPGIGIEPLRLAGARDGGAKAARRHCPAIAAAAWRRRRGAPRSAAHRPDAPP
jgi:hypothetical protein